MRVTLPDLSGPSRGWDAGVLAVGLAGAALIGHRWWVTHHG